MPTQKRSLSICFQRGASVASARMALGCARKLARDGNFKEAERPLKATVEALNWLKFYVYTYDRESLKTVRGFPAEVKKTLKILRSKDTGVVEKVKALEKLDVPLVKLTEKVKESCRGKLPGYAGR